MADGRGADTMLGAPADARLAPPERRGARFGSAANAPGRDPAVVRSRRRAAEAAEEER